MTGGALRVLKELTRNPAAPELFLPALREIKVGLDFLAWKYDGRYSTFQTIVESFVESRVGKDAEAHLRSNKALDLIRVGLAGLTEDNISWLEKRVAKVVYNPPTPAGQWGC